MAQRWQLTTRALAVMVLLAVVQAPKQALAAENAPVWVADLSLFRLLVFGSLAGLALAVIALLLIWFQEWRKGDIW